MEKMKIEIWSDIACPYCYIGKRHMEEALVQFSHADEVELVWHSYELSPDLSKEPHGKSIYQYLAEKYNTTEDEQRINAESVINLAKSVGLEYNFDKLIYTNSSDALRLVKLAKEYDLADEAEERLFKAYFTEGKNISDRSILIQLGSEIGILKKDIEEMLNSDKYLNEIKEDIKYSEEKLNLQYVPFYLFNNKNIIQGIITTEEYLEILEKSYKEWKGEGSTSDDSNRISGRACSIDGTCSL